MANAKPHTHALEIDTHYMRTGSWRITYGDQTTYVWKHFPGWRGRLRRKAKRIVKWHDNGSVWQTTMKNPGNYVNDVVASINNKVLAPGKYNRLEERADIWGKDALNKEEKTSA